MRTNSSLLMVGTILAAFTMVVSVSAGEGARVQTDEHGHRAAAPEQQVAGYALSRGAAGVADWVQLGPFGGDAADIAVSLVDDSVALAGLASATGGGGLYRSTDGGQTWSLVPPFEGVPVFDIEFTASDRVYIGTGDSIWRSADGGLNWTQLPLGIGANDTVLEVTLDPADPLRIWIGIADALGSQAVNVMLTTDGGSNWADMTPPLAAPINGTGITVDSGNSNNVYVCFGGSFGGGQVWVSSTGGASWVNRSAGLPNNPMNDIVHDGSRILLAGGLLFGTQNVGLYETINDGLTWMPLHDGSWPLLVINDVEVDPSDSDVLFAASAGAGAFRSADGGDTWEFGVGGTGSLSLNAARFAPGSSSSIYLGASSVGVLRSTDAGANFEVSSTGIAVLNVVSIDANPDDPQELAIAFSGQNDGGVYTSTNGGESWALESVPATRYNTVRFTPDGTLYAISDGPTTIAPEGLYRRNTDGSWTGIGPDQGPVFETRLLALRFSQNNPDLILTGGADFGVADFEATIWHSPNTGASWTKVYESAEMNETVTDIEILEDGTDTTVLASFVDFGAAPQDGGVLRSTNGGSFWSASSTGLPAEVQGAALCTSPVDADSFYLADQDVGAGLGGLHLSVDGGQTWFNTGYTDAIVLDVVCDPADEQVLYVAQFDDTRVLRSADQGATFNPFNEGLGQAGVSRELGYAGGPAPRLLFASSTSSYATSLASPGRVPATVTVDKSAITPGDLLLQWEPSCSASAEDHAIYEGQIGAWYSHVSIDCSDDLGDLQEEITPSSGNSYYLVVPYNAINEGSYGTDSTEAERPVGIPACVATQSLVPCP